MKLWRCFNPKCTDNGIPGHDFMADEGKCPKCGIEKGDARFGHLIVPRVVLHFDAPSGIVEGRGVGFIACDPSKKVGVFRATGATGAVNCPACMETDSFKAALAADSVHPDFDVPVNVDLKAGRIELKQPCGGC